MKNFVLLILGVVLGALAMYLYYSSDQTEMRSEPATVAPRGIITSKEAIVLDSTYNLRHRIISDSLFSSRKTSDNRSSWWSLEDVQNYINHAENQAGNLGYTMDGLRLYLGAYPEVKGQAGYTTMFFVPTGVKNTSKGSIFSLLQGGGMDIPEGDGLNIGHNGKPPGANYPQ